MDTLSDKIEELREVQSEKELAYTAVKHLKGYLEAIVSSTHDTSAMLDKMEDAKDYLGSLNQYM